MTNPFVKKQSGIIFMMLIAIIVCFRTLSVYAIERDGIDCNCTEDDGAYKNGAKAKKPALTCDQIDPDYCTSKDGTYKVTAAAGPTEVALTVSEVSGNTTLFTVNLPLTYAYWGFSPDNDRFVYHYTTMPATETIDHIRLHDLTGNPATPIFSSDLVVGHATPPLFSPHGKYLLWVNVTNTTHTLIRVVDVITGDMAYEADFNFSVPVEGEPYEDLPEIKKWGGVTWGFSPDNDAASFAYVYRSDQNVVEWNMVNLISGKVVKHITTNAAGVEWQFSPCGDTVAYIENRLEIYLFSTITGDPLIDLVSRDFSPSVIQDNGVLTTATTHQALVGSQYYDLADNTAHNTCEGPSDADGDTVPDDTDNCPDISNLDQADSDGDGIGDVCEEDYDTDGDGEPDVTDNCPDIGNADQSDGDGDGYGDLCDNCPDTSNEDQADNDGNGIGNACSIGSGGTAPTWPTGSTLTAPTQNETSVVLEWSAAEDADGDLSGYLIYRNNNIAAQLGNVLTHEITGLLPADYHTFRIEAKDAEGNLSSGGPTAVAYTPDSTPPTWPTPVSLEWIERTATSITIQWSQATDNNSVAGYRIYLRDGADWKKIADVTTGTNNFRFTCLHPFTGANGKYTFKVEAYDVSSNESADGPQATMYTHQRSEACSTHVTRVSMTLDKMEIAYYEGPGMTGAPAISADGRYIAYKSDADNLGRLHELADVFVYDRIGDVVKRINVSSSGQQSDFGVTQPETLAISADGRYVAFADMGKNLVPNDDDFPQNDVFVHDLDTSETVRVSVSSSGEKANSASNHPDISADGRFVVFDSTAGNLANDSNLYMDVFVHDRDADEDGVFDEAGGISTTRISSAIDGNPENGQSFHPSISMDGKYIAFESTAENLIAGDDNICWFTDMMGRPHQTPCSDIFVYDRNSGTIERVSVATGGSQADGKSFMPCISSNGRYVAFLSTAEDLVADDNNGETDVFVHDRDTDTTERVNLSGSNGQANGSAYGFPSISSDGRFVAFTSTADNLAPDDTNGVEDVFLRDRITAETIRLSECPCDSEQGNNISKGPAISADGNFVAFESAASNLLIGLTDTNNGYDVFLYEQKNIDPTADLFVTKTDSPDPVGADEQVTYTITVSNLGPDNATGVELQDELPSGSNVNFISASADQGVCQESAGTVTCNIGGMAAGSDITATIVVSYPAQTTYTNTVTVVGNEIDPDDSNNTASEETTIISSTPQPDIFVSPINLIFDDTYIGNLRELSITISNNGDGNLILGGIGTQNPLTAPFTIVNTNCTSPDCVNETIVQSADRTAIIGFQPNADAVYSDSFDIASNDPDTDSVTVSVSGNGMVNNTPALDVTPTTLNFGDTTTTGTITISNIGGGTLNWTIGPALPAWLEVSPMSGDTSGGPSTVEVIVQRHKAEGFGNHNTNLKLTSEGGNQDIFIQMEKINLYKPVADILVQFSPDGFRAGDPIQLNGNSSYDPEGADLTYKWGWVFDPETDTFPGAYGAWISDPTSPAPQITSPYPGKYTVGLVVSDGEMESEMVTADITMIENSTDNNLPTAAAGEDRNIIVDNDLELDGTGSSDPDGDPVVSYEWRFIWNEENGTAPMALGATLAGYNTAKPVFRCSRPGEFTLSLVVTDSRRGASEPDYIGITIRDAGLDHADTDGIKDSDELGLNGTESDFDGNDDQIPDHSQNNVASFANHDHNQYLTIATPGQTFLSDVLTHTPPSESGLPEGYSFPIQFFSFTVNNIESGETTMKVYLHKGDVADTYYKYGPTEDKPNPHWYEFLWDGETGAKIDGNVITLHFIDGKRGDDVLTPDGKIIDMGGPGFLDVETLAGEGNSSTGSGDGNCFIHSLQ